MFYVVSDDPQWARKTFETKYDNVMVYIPPKDAVSTNDEYNTLAYGDDIGMYSVSRHKVMHR